MAQENTSTYMVKPPSVHAVPLATRADSQSLCFKFNNTFHARREVGPSISFSFPTGLGFKSESSCRQLKARSPLIAVCTCCAVAMQASIAVTSFIEAQEFFFGTLEALFWLVSAPISMGNLI